MGSLKRSLKEAVRKLAYSTSVDQLKKRGVKQVSVVGLDRIVQLIEEAVNRSLRHRLLLGEREAVIDATREEFLRLLRTNEELKAQHERAQEDAEALRLEIHRLRQELDRRLDAAHAEQRAAYVDQDARIRDWIDAALAEVGEASPDGDQVRERVLELVMDVVGRERRAAEEAKEVARDREVELLQRRIAKLTSSLQETEQRLSKVAEMKEVDPGIASVYREVQGLVPEVSHFQRKQELMAGIFAANLKLQKKV